MRRQWKLNSKRGLNRPFFCPTVKDKQKVYILAPKSNTNQMKTAQDFKLRCSALGTVIAKSGKMTATAKASILSQYLAFKYGKREQIKSKYFAKGTLREEQSITLLSIESGKFYKNNKERLTNEFITGEPDCFEGATLKDATAIIDIKTSWDALTFLKSKTEPLKWEYEWQLKGYAYLTGCKNLQLSYCLVNSTARMIEKERYNLLTYEHGGEENEDFHKAASQIERNHIHDLQAFVDENPDFIFCTDQKNLTPEYFDIPASERVHSFNFTATDEDFKTIENAVIEARKLVEKL